MPRKRRGTNMVTVRFRTENANASRRRPRDQSRRGYAAPGPTALFYPLKELVAHGRILLRRGQNCRVFLDRQALVSDRLCHGIAGLALETFLFVDRRLSQLLVVAVLDHGHFFDGGGGRVELFVGNDCRCRRRAGCCHRWPGGRLLLRLRRWHDQEASRGESQGAPCAESGCRLHVEPPSWG